MAGTNPLIMQYREQEINTMSRGELLIKLYDELIKNMRYGALLFNQNNPESAKKYTTKCKDILNYLVVILDNQYPIAEKLRNIYSFMIGQIIQANVHNQGDYLEKILPMAQELRDAWVQAEKTVQMQNSGKGRERSN
jgi:flagellar protein FliS